MADYIGDFLLGSTVSKRWTTVQATGAPTTLSGSPVIKCYESGNTTPLASGITLVADYNSVTGLNSVSIVASGGNSFQVGKDYDIVITTGTVNSVSAVGYVVGTFSIQNRFTNVAQINGVTQVTPGAAGGLFIAGTNAATTVTTSFTTTFTGNLTGSVANVVGSVASVTAAVTITGDLSATMKTSVTTAATAATPTAAGVSGVTFPASVASPTNITAGTITTVTNLTNAPTAGDFTAAMKTSLNAATPAATIGTGGITAASFAASAVNAAALATDAVNEIADGLLDRNMATGTDSGSSTVRTPRQALRALRNKVDTSVSPAVITKEDDSTTSWTTTLTTDGAALPIVTSDPTGP